MISFDYLFKRVLYERKLVMLSKITPEIIIIGKNKLLNELASIGISIKTKANNPGNAQRLIQMNLSKV